MKIKCLHGYFQFEESRVGQASEFSGLFGVELAMVDGYFTFADLLEAPDYSIAGGDFLGAITTKTFEGKPWEVMRENGLVYDFSDGLVKPIITIFQQIALVASANYFLASGMIQPGSMMEGRRIRDYVAHYSFSKAKFKYSEVGFE